MERSILVVHIGTQETAVAKRVDAFYGKNQQQGQNWQYKGQKKDPVAFLLLGIHGNLLSGKDKQFAGHVIDDHDDHVGTDLTQKVVPVQFVYSNVDKGNIKAQS